MSFEKKLETHVADQPPDQSRRSLMQLKRDMLDEAIEDLDIEKPHYYQSRHQNWPVAFWQGDGEHISIILGKLIAWERKHGIKGVRLPISDSCLYLDMDHDVDGSVMTMQLTVDELPKL